MITTSPDGMHRTLAEAVYSVVRQRILEGELFPGQRLDQDQICRDFQISRTPLREVLRRLESEGLVVIRSHRGAEVARLSIRDIQEIYAIRAVVEGYAARLSAERADAVTIARVKSLLDRIAEATAAHNQERLVELHRDFHTVLYEKAGNQRLAQLISDLRSRCEWFGRAHMAVPRRAETSLEEHRAITEAFCDSDGPRVEALVRRNYENTAKALTEFLLQHRGESPGREVAVE